MNSERLDRLDIMIREGRLVRGSWTEGHERACLLAALSPECGAAQSAAACPAEVMPAWLAELTPWIDDAPSTAAWPAIVRRYAGLARRWNVLDAEGWERARGGALVSIVREARSHVAPEHESALTAIDGVLDWLVRGASESEQLVVLWAAEREALWAPDAAAWAAKAAAAATGVRAATIASAARSAAAAAARAAARALEAARTPWAAAAEASDRIAAGVLDAIEREIDRAEAER